MEIQNTESEQYFIFTYSDGTSEKVFLRDIDSYDQTRTKIIDITKSYLVTPTPPIDNKNNIDDTKNNINEEININKKEIKIKKEKQNMA